MKTEIIKIINPTESYPDIERAASIIRAGGLVVFPTETVYGLGGNGTDPAAATKIYEAKGRPSDNPLILHLAQPSDAESYAVTNENYYRLAAAFMPGPLTIILPKKPTVPDRVTGGLPSVALRCPSHPVAHALIEAAGLPIAAPSANISGRPSPTNARYAIEDLSGRVDMIIDGGDCEIGLESTIISLNRDGALLLRPGAVTYDALCCVLERVEISPAAMGEMTADDRPLAPGMKYRHYAPSSPLVLLDGPDEAFICYIKQKRLTENCAVICSPEEARAIGGENLVLTGDNDDYPAQARRLFSALREADKLGCDVIYARKPRADGLGLALYNRLIRAAAHTVVKI